MTTILLTILVSFWVFRRRWAVRGARTFVLMVVVGGICWQVLTVVHVLVANEVVLGSVVVADKFVGMLASVLFVVFVSQYTNSGFHRRVAARGAFALLLGGFLLLWATNPWHGLLVAGVETFETPFVHASMRRGVLYHLLLALTYTLMAASYRKSRRKPTTSVVR